MKKFVYYLRKMQRNNLFYLAGGIQILCLISYFYASKNLEKPAGLIEAAKFLFYDFDKYLLSICIGIVAWVIYGCLLTSIIFEIPIINELVEDDYNYYRYEPLEEITRNKYILNVCLSIALLILNIMFLKYLSMLLLLIIIIIGIILFYMWSQSQ